MVIWEQAGGTENFANRYKNIIIVTPAKLSLWILFSNSICPAFNFLINYKKLLSHFFVACVVYDSKIEHSILDNVGECLFFYSNHQLPGVVFIESG